jgi:predicted DNA-binding ribbon-helix-helix protein
MSITNSTDDVRTALALRGKTPKRGNVSKDLPEANQNLKAGSFLVSKNVTINGCRTSVRLEPQMWNALDEIARREGIDRHHLFTSIADRVQRHQSLSSAVRTFVMTYFRESSTESGHQKAGHGSRIIG